MGNDDAALPSAEERVRRVEEACAEMAAECSLRDWVERLPPGHRARCEYEQLMATIQLQALVTMKRAMRAAEGGE